MYNIIKNSYTYMKIKLREHKFDSTYNVNGHTITKFSSCKDIGIVFTNSLIWQYHYDDLL